MAASAPGNSTELFEPGDPGVLYLVDLSGYLFRAYHALPPLNSPAGEPTHAVLGVTTMLLKLVADQRPALLAVAMDSRARSFRHGLYSEYKANRPKAPEDLQRQLLRIRDIVAAYQIPVFQQEGMEADDVIASAVRQARARGLRVVIVSADKDLLQLVGPDVLLYDTGRNKVYGIPETQQKLGVLPHQVRDYLALVGDSSDNVPGVPSVGPKTAAKLLADFDDLTQLYDRLQDVDKANLRNKLQQHREQAELSRQLVTLKDDVPVDLEVELLQRKEPDLATLRGLFVELGFTRLLAQLAEDASPELQAPPAEAQEALAELLSGPAELVDNEAALQALAAALASEDELSLCTIVDGPRPLYEPLVGVGLLCADRTWYVPLDHRLLGAQQLPLDRVKHTLAGPLCDPRLRKLTADAKREYLAWNSHGVEIQGMAFDAGLVSYLLDPDRHGHTLSEICQELFQEPLPAYAALIRRPAKSEPPSARPIDEVAHLTGQLLRATAACAARQAQRLSPPLERLFRALELPLSRVLSGMERDGIRVDTDRLLALAQQAETELVQLERRCQDLAGHDFNVASPRQLETILFDELQLPVIKKTKTARSTDHSVLEELAIVHELPAAILEHRMLAKLKSTYLDALPREVHPKTGRVHTVFRQTVAATGRLSSSDPNLQNIPIRREFGRRIREAFVPAEGWALFSADYSQIELRVLAHLSQDAALLSAFRDGEDVHVRTARAIFGVEPDDVTREMRGQAKTVNFAVIYGQTQFALSRNLRIPRSEAARYIKAFFEQYAGVQQYMERVVEEGRELGRVQTLSGRVRHLPDLRSRNRVKRQAAERVARNTPIQGTAADIIKRAMIAAANAMEAQGLQSRMLLSVHDELVFEAPPAEQTSLTGLVHRCMEGAMTLDVPLEVESAWGRSWGEAH